MQSVYNNVAPITEWSRESNELRRGGEYRVINSLFVRDIAFSKRVMRDDIFMNTD